MPILENIDLHLPSHKRERRKDARPGELLDAALELFVEKGYAATKVEEVAAHAGVSKGTLFLYFQSKQELFEAVVRKNIADHFPTWNQEFEQFTGSTAEMLVYALESWWDRIGNTAASGITKLLMSEARNFPELADFYTQEVIKPGNELFVRIFQRGIDRGEFRSVPLPLTIYSVISVIMFLTMWKHSFSCTLPDAQIDPKKFIHNHMDLLINGLVKKPTQGS
jgi:TetR/AcrR family transcriptional regulator